MRAVRVLAPSDLPLSELQARVHLRHPDMTENSELLSFIRSGVEAAEQKLGRAILTQTWDVYLDGFPCGYATERSYRPAYIELPWPPLQSITHIKYQDGSDVQQTLASSDYVIDASGDRARVRLAYGKSWPATYYSPSAVVVRQVVGYADVDLVPESIVHWIKCFVEAADKNRGLLQERPTTLNPFLDGLLDRWKVVSV